MKNKLLLFTLFLFANTYLFGQSLLKTQDASSASKIIIPFKDNYFIYNDGNRHLHEYNSKHQFVKYANFEKEYLQLNVFLNNGTLAILEGEEDQCDIFPRNAFSVDKNGKVKKLSAYNYLGTDYEQNVYFKLKNGTGIEIRKWSDSSFVATIKLNDLGNNPIFIPLEKDTFLVGDGNGLFYKSTPFMKNLVKIPNFLSKTSITARSIINTSTNYFFVKGQGIYSRKTLKLVLPSSDNSINLKEINGKIYIFKNTAQEYAPDNSGNLIKTNKILTAYEEKGLILNDFTPFKNKLLVCGGSPFHEYKSGQTSSKYYQDFHGVVDSLTQKVSNFHDISFNIPPQKDPVWDKKCGYRFENVELLIENKGKDTLKSLLLRSDGYDYIPVGCFGGKQDFWRLDNLSIPPNTKFTYQYANFCTKGIQYNNTTKDSTRTICIKSSSPNQNLDNLYKDNYSCFSFPKDPKENFTKSSDISELNINIYNDENTLFINGDKNLQNAKLVLYSIDGRLVFSEKLNDVLPLQIDISHLPKAMYIAQLIVDNQRFITKKIVK